MRRAAADCVTTSHRLLLLPPPARRVVHVARDVRTITATHVEGSSATWALGWGADGLAEVRGRSVCESVEMMRMMCGTDDG